ncbi:hypothetical protein SMICM17S_06569 [Streptomyces microflavus]
MREGLGALVRGVGAFVRGGLRVRGVSGAFGRGEVGTLVRDGLQGLSGLRGEPQGGGAPGEGAGPGVGVPDAEERVGLPLDEQVVAEGARSWPAGRSSPQRTASAPSRSSSSPAVAPAGTGRIRGSGTGACRTRRR